MKEIIQKTIAILTRQERKKLLFLMVSATLISILDIAALALLVYIIGFYTQASFNNNLGFLAAWFSDPKSLSPLIVFVILFILKNLAAYLISQAQYKYVYNVAARLSADSMSHYLSGSYNEYVNVDSSVHIRRISQQPIEFSQYVLTGLQQIFTELLLCVLAIAAILLFKAKLFLLISILLLIPLLLIAWFTKSRLRTARTHIKSSSEKMLQHLHEALSGYIESNIYGKRSFFSHRYAAYQQKLNNYLSDLQGTQSITSRFVEVFAVLGFLILVTINRQSGNATATEIIDIGAFMAAAYKIIPSIIKISNLSSQVKTYRFTLNELPQNKTDTQQIITNNIKSIQFKNVSYSRQNKKIIHELSISLERGNLIGISGVSGKGKTTFINLLLGFIEPEAGTISVNGIVSGTAKRKEFWSDIAYVKQQTFLIHDTIANNIILDDTTPDKERLENVITRTGLKPFIKQLPDKDQTIITENGKNISGGQRQRIALARALYKNASLLILDEPFNELDAASEIKILEYLKELSIEGKLILLITHNTESLSFCSKTISIE